MFIVKPPHLQYFSVAAQDRVWVSRDGAPPRQRPKHAEVALGLGFGRGWKSSELHAGSRSVQPGGCRESLLKMTNVLLEPRVKAVLVVRSGRAGQS